MSEFASSSHATRRAMQVPQIILLILVFVGGGGGGDIWTPKQVGMGGRGEEKGEGIEGRNKNPTIRNFRSAAGLVPEGRKISAYSRNRKKKGCMQKAFQKKNSRYSGKRISKRCCMVPGRKRRKTKKRSSKNIFLLFPFSA